MTKRYRVVEEVTFEYIWEVEASSKAEAYEITASQGDGDALEHNEVDRRPLKIVQIDPPRPARTGKRRGKA